MKNYEVFLRLMSHGRRIGKVCVCVTAASPFLAALEAEKRVDRQYGIEVYGHIEKVLAGVKNDMTQAA